MKIDKPIYAPSGKYKLALNDKGDITFIDTVPSDKVDIVYTEPLTEYLAPEAFVSQNGVQALVDPETGEYTFTPQSVAIVNEEHHRPLNPYTRYMQQKGVAPKDNEVEHLMKRHRADQAGERADLTPFFANLMTGGYAEAAKRGWEDIKNKKYFTGGTEILSPLMFGENYWNNLAQGLYGGVHLLNDNGIPKTVGLIIGNRNDGITGNKVTDIGLSLTGDLINGLLAYSGGNTGIIDGLAASGNKWAKGYAIGKALKGDINSTILKQQNPYIEWNAPITLGRNTELPRITTENMVGKSADSWEAAYSRALNSGNTEEAQRLIDLRWNNDAPNTKYNGDLYHNTTERFTAFDPEFMGKTDAGYYGHGFYFTPNKTDINNALGPIQKHVYVNLENPRNLTASDYVSGELLGNDGAIVRNGEEGWLNLDGAPAPDPNEVMEVVVNKPENIKSVAPVTYDNNGWTIPITERFHFNPQDVDIRGRGWFGEPIQTSSKISDVRGIEGTPTEIKISPEELYKFLQEQEGYYFLGHGTGRNPGASEAIFNSGLRTKTGDISDTTIPLSESNLASWPHLNSEEIVILPGKIENVKYDYPYGRIPTDWFDNTTFSWNDNPGFSGRGIMAQENPHASFTKSIVDGIPGVYTKPEAVLGTYNTRTHTLQINPNSQYKFPLVRQNGTHFFTGTQETLPEVKFRGIIPKGEGNPLDTRLQRMMLRSKLKQENPEIYNLIYDENNPFVLPDQSISIVPRVRYDNVRKAMLDIDPSLSDVDLDMGIQIALANKKGVHFDLGNKSGDTIGGVNIVEIADAVNMVRKLHGREAIPYDISMIAGHELGHGVQLSDDALRAVSGYYDPYEFYTQAGQVLDNAGIINNTLSPLSFNKFINLTNSYLANGNLDNGITKMRDFLMSLSPLERQAVMKNINRFSAGLFGAYLIGKGINNGKVQS